MPFEVGGAILLLLLVVAFVPRPGIQIVDVRFEADPCNFVTTTYVARAIVTLANKGGADGELWIYFLVDGVRRASEAILVPAHASVERTLTVSITDCDPHGYSVTSCMPAGDSVCYP